MSEKVMDPVSDIPPITRNVSRRRSKWDRRIEEVWDMRHEDDPTLPLKFGSEIKAASASRRIRERAKLFTKGEVKVVQRGTVLYLTGVE